MSRSRPANRYGKPPSPFNLGTLINVGGIPLLTIGFGVLAFYFTTGATLTQHSAAIEKLQIETKTTTDVDLKAKEELRKQFLEAQNKNLEILGKLDTRLAVAETKQETANQTLSKIADELSRITSIVPRK
jgi:hypothetical protein